jgi:hypothetical protein
MTTPPDDFGNCIRFAPYVTAEERAQPPAPGVLYEIVQRWEVCTSTYGGDTVTDCCEV